MRTARRSRLICSACWTISRSRITCRTRTPSRSSRRKASICSRRCRCLMRIRTEKQRLYAQIADRVFQINREKPLSGIVLGSVGVDAGAVVPHLHTYVHDLVFGVVKLSPKQATPAQVRDAALALREERERAWERAHADAVKDGVPRGWAVNGADPTLKALSRGQVRTLLADGQDDDPRIDEAVEEALRQRAQVDVLYDDKARRVVDGLAALLRFRA